MGKMTLLSIGHYVTYVLTYLDIKTMQDIYIGTLISALNYVLKREQQ